MQKYASSTNVKQQSPPFSVVHEEEQIGYEPLIFDRSGEDNYSDEAGGVDEQNDNESIKLPRRIHLSTDSADGECARVRNSGVRGCIQFVNRPLPVIYTHSPCMKDVSSMNRHERRRHMDRMRARRFREKMLAEGRSAHVLQVFLKSGLDRFLISKFFSI
jgi:hypothetical protein